MTKQSLFPLIRKMIIISIGLIYLQDIRSQVVWINDFDAAKTVAFKSEKLVIMDFWASWCGPCITMDKEVWNDRELMKLARNFVGLRVNVDLDKKTPSLYNVSIIPKVVIMTANGEVIWDKEAYDNADNFLAVFKAIPQNTGELNKASVNLAEKKKDIQANYSVGLEFQKLGRNITNNELKNSFLGCSAKFLNKALILCKDPFQSEQIGLYLILNDVYSGKHQKVLKQMEKMDPKPGNEDLGELRHFILAKSYLLAGDNDNYNKERQQLKKQELLDQLDN